MTYQRRQQGFNQNTRPQQTGPREDGPVSVRVFNTKDSESKVRTLTDATRFNGLLGTKNLTKLRDLLDQAINTGMGVSFNYYVGTGQETGQLESFFYFQPAAGSKGKHSSDGQKKRFVPYNKQTEVNTQTAELAAKTIKEGF